MGASSDSSSAKHRGGPGMRMDARRSRAAVIAVIAVCTMVVAGCTGSASDPASSPGNVSPGTSLAAVTPAGTKPVSSVVWATNRDVISLDPITSARLPGIHDRLPDV